jgi:hypothetical protein
VKFANITYEKFLADVHQMHENQPIEGYLRLGQIYFNVLCSVRPHIAEQLRGSMLDPFFKERITQVVQDFVRERW